MSFDQEPDPLSDALEHCQRLVKERDALAAANLTLTDEIGVLRTEMARLRKLLAVCKAVWATVHHREYDDIHMRDSWDKIHDACCEALGDPWTPLPAPPGQEGESCRDQ